MASDWPDGMESIVTYLLQDEKQGCKLIFTQTGIPEAFADQIKQGWIDFYWNPLKKFLQA